MGLKFLNHVISGRGLPKAVHSRVTGEFTLDILVLKTPVISAGVSGKKKMITFRNKFLEQFFMF